MEGQDGAYSLQQSCCIVNRNGKKKEAPFLPIKKEVSPVQITKDVGDFDFMTLCETTVFNASSGGLDATRDRTLISLEPWSQDSLLSQAKQWKES
jgi:hypothetical protein